MAKANTAVTCWDHLKPVTKEPIPFLPKKVERPLVSPTEEEIETWLEYNRMLSNMEMSWLSQKIASLEEILIAKLVREPGMRKVRRINRKRRPSKNGK